MDIDPIIEENNLDEKEKPRIFEALKVAFDQQRDRVEEVIERNLSIKIFKHLLTSFLLILITYSFRNTKERRKN